MRWAVVTVLCVVLGALQTAAVAAAAGTGDQGEFTGRVLDLTNAERANAGLAPLAVSAELQDSAQGYSEVLASSGCFEHTCGLVRDFADRDNQAGYTGWTALGENIAAGYPTPEAVVAGWMASPGHRANMLSSEFTEIGIGLSRGPGKFGTYWAQEFGTRVGTGVGTAASSSGADDTAD